MSGDVHRTETVPFVAGDGRELNLVHVRGKPTPAKGPVLLVHGAGVRANIFRSPTPRSIVDALIDEGYDVWLENWRASIDLPPNHWTLDQAAVFDHPRAVETVAGETGANEIQAVIHCQGSTSFMMSAVAGLVPQVTTVVANAVTLHTIVPPLAKLKMRWVVPAAGRLLGYIDPQWGTHGAPGVLPKLISAYVYMTHRECDNRVCRLASYTYGTGHPTLWRHENLNPPTHEWIRDEFAACPMTFFRQMYRCIDAGHLVSVDGRPELPHSFVAAAPQTDARFAFLTGALNNCFLPESQRRTYEWFERHTPGRHSLHVLDGYGHLDPFLGQRAAHDVFPVIIGELQRGRAG